MMCDFEVYTVLSVRHILSVALHKGHAKALQKLWRSYKIYKMLIWWANYYIHDNYQYARMSNKTL